ncbi:MAG: CHAT domain-containing protein, partial [Acidobacteriota bacterium]
MAKTILVLTANPEGTKPIHADRELRAIRGALERSRLRDHVDLQVRGAVDRQTIRRAILDLRPTVVHFSSHGVEDGGLVIEGQDGIPEILGGEDLGAFFGLFSHHLKCVVLCACNSAGQALHISARIDIVIGMSSRVADAAVREYSTAFYDALLAGRGFVEAHGIASLAIGCSDPADPTCPQLSARPGGDREGLGCSDDLFGDGDPAANDAPAQPSFGASMRDV